MFVLLLSPSRGNFLILSAIATLVFVNLTADLKRKQECLTTNTPTCRIGDYFLGCVVQLSKQQVMSRYKILNFVTFYARLL